MRICEDMFYDPIATIRFRISDAIEQAITLRIIDRMSQVSFFLMAKRFSIADEKLKITRVRLIDARIVNLIHDAVTQREPNTAAGMIGCANSFLGARSPAGRDSRCTKCD